MKAVINLHPNQLSVIHRAVEVLRHLPFVYLAAEMRTGKTPISLTIINHLLQENLNFNSVLFLTKKRVIDDVLKHWQMLKEREVDFMCINYEQLHKLIEGHRVSFDVIVLDEAHGLGAFPKPSLRARNVRRLTASKYILMSGTPTPESYSQIYHQLWAINQERHRSFYAFAGNYVTIREKRYANNVVVNDYSTCNADAISEYVGDRMITLTQEDVEIPTIKRYVEEVVAMPASKTLANQLMQNGFIEYMGEQIIAENAAREMSMMHQLCGGFVYVQSHSPEYRVFDTSKCSVLVSHLKKYNKACVFYYYKAEYDIIYSHLKTCDIEVTDDYAAFKQMYRGVFLVQIGSGAEGITLKDTEALIYYNISFSATQHIQSQERATHFENDRSVDIIYLFSDTGFERRVMKVLQKKKRYTKEHYMKFKNEII